MRRDIVHEVLVVEDEAPVRALTIVALQRHGYQVIEASGPMEALQLSDAVLNTVDVLLADIVMPFMSGHALAKRLRVRRPDLRVLFMSGYGGQNSHDGAEPLLKKPFTAPILLEAVRGALSDPRPRAH